MSPRHLQFLNDVGRTPPTNGQVPVWNAALGLFVFGSAGVSAANIPLAVSGSTVSAMAQLAAASLGRRYYRAYANGGATSRTVIGCGAGTPQGTLGTTVEEAEGFQQPWTTAGTTGSTAGGLIYSLTQGLVQTRWKPVYACAFKTPSTITSYRVMAGMFATGSPSSNDNVGVASIGIRYSTAVPDSGWVAITHNGSSQTTSSQIYSFAADTAYLLVLDCTDSASIKFWMGTDETDLTLVHTATGTLPSSSTTLYPQGPHCCALSNNARSVKFNHMAVAHR